MIELKSQVKAESRESGIELLRIVLMFCIVIHHLIVHGSRLVDVESLSLGFFTCQKLVYEAFVLFPVDCFVFISGFYGIRFSLKKTATLWLQCLFYSLAITLVFFYQGDVGLKHVVKAFFPVSTAAWWFITCYIFLMLLSPALNAFMECGRKGLIRYTLVVYFAMNCVVSFVFGNDNLAGTGSTLLSLGFVYCLGRYVALYGKDLRINRVRCAAVFLGCCALMAALTILAKRYGAAKYIWLLYRFNNPMIIAEAICLFYVFKGFRFSSRAVNHVAGSVFAVYVLHDHKLVRGWLYSRALPIDEYSGDWSYILYLVFFAAVIFLAALVIETLRKLVFDPVLSRFFASRTFRAVDEKIMAALRGNGT